MGFEVPVIPSPGIARLAAYLAALNCGLIKNTSELIKMWKSVKIYKPKIKKNIINKETKKWKKTIDLLIKYHS